jgi:hypothetical protein
MDFQRHYRPDVNVVGRPVQSGGKGYHLIGPHEILFPLLMAAVDERSAGGGHTFPAVLAGDTLPGKLVGKQKRRVSP